MKLRVYLDAKRITYREFAEMLGVHIQSVKNIVYGHRSPSLRLAMRIQELTEGEVTPGDLIMMSNKKPESEPKPKRKSLRKKIM